MFAGDSGNSGGNSEVGTLNIIDFFDKLQEKGYRREQEYDGDVLLWVTQTIRN